MVLEGAKVGRRRGAHGDEICPPAEVGP
jgi:hypothetical protein